MMLNTVPQSLVFDVLVKKSVGRVRSFLRISNRRCLHIRIDYPQTSLMGNIEDGIDDGLFLLRSRLH